MHPALRLINYFSSHYLSTVTVSSWATGQSFLPAKVWTVIHNSYGISSSISLQIWWSGLAHYATAGSCMHVKASSPQVCYTPQPITVNCLHWTVLSTLVSLLASFMQPLFWEGKYLAFILWRKCPTYIIGQGGDLFAGLFLGTGWSRRYSPLRRSC